MIKLQGENIGANCHDFRFQNGMTPKTKSVKDENR